MIRFQKYLLLALAAVLLLAVTLFRKGWFLGGDMGIWVYRILAPASLLLAVYAVGSLLGRKVGGVLVLLLFLSEGFLFWMFRAAANQRQLPHPLTEFLQDLYLLHCRDVVVHHEDRSRYDSELFYTLKPGTFQFSNFEFSTEYRVNSAGFRDDEASLHAPDIICLGDSYAMGWGVSQEEAFPSLLEKSPGGSVLNLGMASYGTAREWIAFERLRAAQTQLIVLQYCPNDEAENRAFVQNDYHLKVSPPETLREDRRWFQLLRTYFPLKYCHASLAEVARRIFRKTAPKKPESGITIQALSDFYSIVKKMKAGFSGNIVICSMSPHALPEEDAKMESFFEKRPIQGVYFLPVAALLSAADYFVLDDHIRASGHRKVAKALAAFILGKKLLNR